MRTIQISGIDLPASVIGLGTMIFHPDTARRDWGLLVAWSSLGRGFFSRAKPNERGDADLVRVFYSGANFERKRRAMALAEAMGQSLFQIALAYVTSQSFPTIALCGARTVDQVTDAVRSGDLVLSSDQRGWLDLSTDEQPI